MKDYLFIINPAAGKGTGTEVIPVIKNEFKDYDITIKISNRINGVTELVSNELRNENYEVIVSVGGDGTLTELVNGIIDKDIIIGILPIGSGNDFAKTLKLPKNIHENIEKLKEKNFVYLYNGKANDIRFINVFGMGIDTEILRSREESKKNDGLVSYLFSTIRALLTYKPKKYKIILDDQIIEEEIYMIGVGNGKYIGDGMKITPNADIYSKKFEICIIPKIKKWKLLMALPTIYRGQHGSVEGIEFYKSRKVEIFYSGNDYMNLDGNLYQGNQVVLEKPEKKLKIIK